MERHYYEELMTLASGIYHWAHAASEQNGSVNDIKICLQEMRSRCKQAEKLSIICQYGIIEDLTKKGE